jgi:hypothetical protein
VARPYGLVRVNVVFDMVVEGKLVSVIVIGSEHITMVRMPWLAQDFARAECAWYESQGAKVPMELFRALCNIGMGKELTPEEQAASYQLFYDECPPRSRR